MFKTVLASAAVALLAVPAVAQQAQPPAQPTPYQRAIAAQSI